MHKNLSTMTKPIIILVAPQMGENIGAVARAMKNFSLDELRIVAPRDGWPNEKAISMAVGAADIVENANIYQNLNEAISDLAYLYATTAQARDMNKDYVSVANLYEDFPKATKTGIMFGRESSGLTNEEIALANKIITINTNPEFTSLNIAQAVLLVSYELFHDKKDSATENATQKLATKQELEYFLEHLFVELDKTPFFRTSDKRTHMILNIKNIFTRIEKFSSNEVQTLRGIITSLTRNF